MHEPEAEVDWPPLEQVRSRLLSAWGSAIAFGTPSGHKVK